MDKNEEIQAFQILQHNQNRLKNGIIIKKGRFVSLQVYDMTFLLLKPHTAAKKKPMNCRKRSKRHLISGNRTAEQNVHAARRHARYNGKQPQDKPRLDAFNARHTSAGVQGHALCRDEFRGG